jgi:protein SCO1/2
MKLRNFSRVIVVALVVAVAAVIVVHDRLAESHANVALQGADLGRDPAPQFSLVDQNGAAVSLSQLKGHPVVITFLYTHCPDECPLTASKLSMAADTLGKQASDVGWVAVSLDPSGDTPAAATDFVAKHHLDGRLHYLLGTQEQLAPVWTAYHTVVQQVQQGSDVTLSHNLGIFLIDAQGKERVYLGSDFTPDMLAGDLHALLNG